MNYIGEIPVYANIIIIIAAWSLKQSAVTGMQRSHTRFHTKENDADHAGTGFTGETVLLKVCKKFDLRGGYVKAHSLAED